jgi:hypothetical protein
VLAGTISGLTLVGETSNGVPLQVTVVREAIFGTGCTVTISVKLDPVQFPVVGITV